MKTGLVLEGGAMRGMYTAGVLDVMIENNVQSDIVVGVSAGALFGVNYLSRQVGRVIRYNKRFNRDLRYMGLIPFLQEGNMISTEYAYNRVPRDLDPFDNEAFMDSDVPFYAVVTNIATGEAEYIRLSDLFQQMDVLRASGSMPLVSVPVEIEGKKYLDGGIGDSIPYAWMLRQNVDKMIVVLTQDGSYRKTAMSPLLTRIYSHWQPAVARQLKNRHLTYNHSLDELRTLEAQGKAFVFRPSQPIHIKTIERSPEKLQSVYDLGRKDAEHMLPALLEYLNK